MPATHSPPPSPSRQHPLQPPRSTPSPCAHPPQANDLRRDLGIAREVNGRLRDEGQQYRSDAESFKRQLDRAESERAAAASQLASVHSSASGLVDDVDKLRRQVGLGGGGG